MDETYVKVQGRWKYLYRAVDQEGQTIDFLLTAHWEGRSALFAEGGPKVTIDQSGANTAALKALIEATDSEIEIRQIKYLNTIVEQDHRAVKRLVRPMLGFKSFRSARLAGIELMHMLKKGQMIGRRTRSLRPPNSSIPWPRPGGSPTLLAGD